MPIPTYTTRRFIDMTNKCPTDRSELYFTLTMPEDDEAPSATLHRIRPQTYVSASPTSPPRSKTCARNKEIKSSSTTRLPPYRAASTPPERPEVRQRHHSNTQGKFSPAVDAEPVWARSNASRRKGQYFDEAFALREPHHIAKSRAARDSFITVQVKLNCCIDSEQEFLVDMAFLISEIYQRPASCVMVLVNTDYSILLGSSSEPAYQISISAMGREVAATKNRRTAGLVQEFMLEAVNILPNRGVLSFHTINEENQILSGQNVQREVRRDENSDDAGNGLLRDFMDSTRPRSRGNRKLSVAKATNLSRCGMSPTQVQTLSSSGADQVAATVTTMTDDYVDKKRVKKRRSLMALLGF